MVRLIRSVFYFGPLIFAYGFIMPLTAQIIGQAGWTMPFGLSPLMAGLLVASALGIPAQIRGSWI
ncbi:MAG: hypothetical protein WA989_17060 [Henriciella sp.]|uniref:hypothetical protein n=1 Tax=Henriciella sp. TaxID=1968823 RepID=UPI003C731B1F